MFHGDTIAAISSSAAPSARMIIRVSGSLSHDIAKKLCDAFVAQPSTAKGVRVRFGSFDFPASVYVFAAPASYTAEDLIELHIPGNALLARLLLDEIIKLGARHAEAGEFTARAFFNGKIGLTEAEGVAATIAAQNQSELRAARQLLAGELARRLSPMLASLTETLALVEAGIDFSEEDISFISARDVVARAKEINAALDELTRSSARFERLSHEPQMILVGRPNAGKSTLLNALAGHERAIVSPTAGTTRDALSADVRLARGIVRIIDVAGLDEASGGEIETQMTLQALRAVESADLVVLVRGVNDVRADPPVPRPIDLIVQTKVDLVGNALADAVSAVTGKNLESLRARLDVLAFGESTGASLALNARHLRAIQNTQTTLRRVDEQLHSELAAAELRSALNSLGDVLGQVSPDDVLGHVFSTFCIGK